MDACFIIKAPRIVTPKREKGGSDSGMIEFGGLVLCERDKKTCNRETFLRLEADRKKVNSLSGLDGLPADHGFPITFNSQIQGTLGGNNHESGFM